MCIGLGLEVVAVVAVAAVVAVVAIFYVYHLHRGEVRILFTEERFGDARQPATLTFDRVCNGEFDFWPKVRPGDMKMYAYMCV
jgi:hypothetical protein